MTASCKPRFELSLRFQGNSSSKTCLQVSPQEKRKGTVVEHFLPTDVSAITKDSDVLKGCKLLFLNYGSHSKAEMEGLVARLGGTVSAVSVAL